jgi:hypothetical protein
VRDELTNGPVVVNWKARYRVHPASILRPPSFAAVTGVTVRIALRRDSCHEW